MQTQEIHCSRLSLTPPLSFDISSVIDYSIFMKKIILCACLLVLVLAGCSKKQEEEPPVPEAEPQIPIEEEEIVELPKWIPGEYPRIGLFFGYGYQTEEEQAPVLAELSEEFGLYSEKGLIVPFTFPDVYYTNKKVSSSFIFDYLDGYDLMALIFVGSPDKIHYSLADLQDAEVDFPVFSIFPQDDVAGTEAGSFLVLDWHASASEEGDEAFENAGFSGDLCSILIPLIHTIKTDARSGLHESVSLFSEALTAELKEHLQNLNIRHYVDPETGIKAYNHFVLGETE